MISRYQTAYFLLSVADVKQLPPDQGIEVAFAGRSNAGKSSVINRLTRRKNLARVSKTPGRTQLLNFFVIDNERRLVDLPGYGFAKAPLYAKKNWQKTVDAYFQKRKCLKGIILIMDIRHPLQDLDWEFLNFCQHYELPVHILLNKADKLSKSAMRKQVDEVKSALTAFSNSVTLQCFSSLKGIGINELYSVLDHWYQFKAKERTHAKKS